MTSDLKGLLRTKGFKATPSRLAVLSLFSNECGPIDAKLALAKLKSKKINLVTIYRTLSSLEQAGVLKKVDLQRESVHYELSENHHHHVVCTHCGKTESFETCEISSIVGKILKNSPQFQSISGHSLELFGICKKCASTA
jgi:Fe2+ or Zn2+ uptake regulation protein